MFKNKDSTIELCSIYVHNKNNNEYMPIELKDVNRCSGYNIKTVIYKNMQTGNIYIKTIDHFLNGFTLKEGN